MAKITTRPSIPHRNPMHPEANWAAEDMASYIDGEPDMQPDIAGRGRERGGNLARKITAGVVAGVLVAGALFIVNKLEGEAKIKEHNFQQEQADNDMARNGTIEVAPSGVEIPAEAGPTQP